MVPPLPMPSVPLIVPLLSERQLPPTAKQPFARLIPPVVENEEVAVEKLMPLVLPIERSDPGVVVPIPTLPVLGSIRASSLEAPDINLIG